MKQDVMKDILVVDDDVDHRAMLTSLIPSWGYAVHEAGDGSIAIEMVTEKPYDLILMDIKMLKVSGIEATEKIRQINPAIPIIIMTAYSSVETAVEALKKGANDYLMKPLDFTGLKDRIDELINYTDAEDENIILKQLLGDEFRTMNIIGRSKSIITVMDTVARVASTDATVLIIGESGTGKEIVAGALHYNSLRKDGPFVKINCASFSEGVLESELFGHEKGAFTGAFRRKEGCFFQANKGTLFLDEVSEMPLSMQAKLLRVIQESEFRRVGGDEPVKVDIRLIAATNRNIKSMVQENRFREDLMYRLNVVSITLDPLRERSEDIPVLAEYFLNTFSEKYKKKIKDYTPQAMDEIKKYSWPGNVRELMNTIERAVILSKGDHLGAAEVHPCIDGHKEAKPEVTGDMSLEELEKQAIIKTMDTVGGNKSEAARRLGITRMTLIKKLKIYSLE